MAFLDFLPPSLIWAIAGILVVVGLVFAFFGRGILKSLMAMIGAILGGIIGFLAGALLGGSLLAIGLGLVGSFIGFILFWKLVKIGFALALGVLAAALVFIAFGTPTGTGAGDSRVIGAIVAFIVIFAIAYYFIEELVGIITALIGGILVGVGAYLFLGPNAVGGVQTWVVAAGVGAVVFFAGAFVQTVKVRRQKRAKAAMAAPRAYASPPPPPPPPPQ
jgi:hypothetical protein